MSRRPAITFDACRRSMRSRSRATSSAVGCGCCGERGGVRGDRCTASMADGWLYIETTGVSITVPCGCAQTRRNETYECLFSHTYTLLAYTFASTILYIRTAEKKRRRRDRPQKR